MSSISPVAVKLTRTFYVAFRSGRFANQTHAGQKSKVLQPAIGPAVCIEAAVAVTLVTYIGWVCFRGWYFEEPIVTSDHMIMLSLLILVAALGAKLFWIAWSTVDSWLRY